eukprot:PhM_4_TR14077/c6_g2_i3/m.60801
MELPTICTNYSGMVDFATPETSYLIPIDGLAELGKETAYGYQRGKKWALPNTKATGDLMRYVFENPTVARARGKIARAFVAAHFSEDIVADKVVDRLKEIRKKVRNRTHVKKWSKTSDSDGYFYYRGVICVVVVVLILQIRLCAMSAVRAWIMRKKENQ